MEIALERPWSIQLMSALERPWAIQLVSALERPWAIQLVSAHKRQLAIQLMSALEHPWAMTTTQERFELFSKNCRYYETTHECSRWALLSAHKWFSWALMSSDERWWAICTAHAIPHERSWALMGWAFLSDSSAKNSNNSNEFKSIKLY